jgi:hypothetical protein
VASNVAGQAPIRFEKLTEGQPYIIKVFPMRSGQGRRRHRALPQGAVEAAHAAARVRPSKQSCTFGSRKWTGRLFADHEPQRHRDTEVLFPGVSSHVVVGAGFSRPDRWQANPGPAALRLRSGHPEQRRGVKPAPTSAGIYTRSALAPRNSANAL